MKFLIELKRRNPVLFWFALLNLAYGLICAVMTRIDQQVVLGINAWIKPMKFYFSICIFCATMAWYLFYLDRPVVTRRYSVMAILVFIIEMSIITWQAANGRISHFNTSTPLYQNLFILMGVAIVVLTIWTAYIGLLFFRLPKGKLPSPYLWGIRLGIFCFVLFAFEGGVMSSLLRHTIGAPDGGPGWPVVNWSRAHGDLRVAHFFGIHALQIWPLAGYYLAPGNKQFFLFAGLYFIMTVVFLVQALMGIPIF